LRDDATIPAKRSAADRSEPLVVAPAGVAAQPLNVLGV
jgi:hypothetical protein